MPIDSFMLSKKFLSVVIFVTLLTQNLFADQTIQIVSPDGNMRVELVQQNDGKLLYSVFYKTKKVITSSLLGMKFSTPNISLTHFNIISTDTSYVDEKWNPIWGEVSSIRNNYKQLIVSLLDRLGTNIQLQLIFRIFNDGVGFRYSFPQQNNLNHFIIADELTEFIVTGDHKTFWIPGDYDTNEYAYLTTSLSAVDALNGKANQAIFAKTPIGASSVQTPLMMKSANGIYINIHEAALVN